MAITGSLTAIIIFVIIFSVCTVNFTIVPAAIKITGKKAVIENTGRKVIGTPFTYEEYLPGSVYLSDSLHSPERLFFKLNIVDNDGKILLKGKEVKILIDDKPVELDSKQLQELMESMPGSLIEKIEVMTTPPPQFWPCGQPSLEKSLSSAS